MGYEETEDMDNSIGYEENQMLKNENMRLQGQLSGAGLFDGENSNAIKERLDTDKILERIEHFLKGDQITIGEQGAYYIPPTKKVLATVNQDPKTKIKFYIQEIADKKKGTEKINEVLVKIKNSDDVETDVLIEDSDKVLKTMKGIKGLKNLGYEYIQVIDDSKRPFNEYGVSELMRTMSMYVNKETILSAYKEDRINEILSDLGNALADFFYSNYEKMGMDTKFKESKFTLIALNLLHVVENCYRRALGGAEQRNLALKGIVSQSGGFGDMAGINPALKPKWNLFKRATW